MSATTPGTIPSSSTVDALQCPAPKNRTRVLVGLFALSMMLPLGTRTEIEEHIAGARTQTHTIETDIGELSDKLVSLPATLRAEVTDAVGSAQAAIHAADVALADAAARKDEHLAVVELIDAQTALDAASAQVRYVTGLAARTGDPVTSDLDVLARHIDQLRGAADTALT